MTEFRSQNRVLEFKFEYTSSRNQVFEIHNFEYKTLPINSSALGNVLTFVWKHSLSSIRRGFRELQETSFCSTKQRKKRTGFYQENQLPSSAYDDDE
ncbi:hypothetical protein E3N88_10492 [Mikania micrantha]|uniref:Uncharacterized protein n=1 Tax=Mikania micrantha TaxID=192012 RepID=A0A5N6PAM7_9ASTR|nr:hypothetical protein E3N88_10492 [Mikania micrantha]